jgi:hypothetical protein
MNQRIQELMEQATSPSHRSQGIGGEPTHIYPGALNPEQFAQLIVQECLAIAKNWEDQLDSANSLSESNAVGIVAYRIARQFGVKR